MKILRRIVFWIGWNVPLWHLNPHLIAFGIGAKKYNREPDMMKVVERLKARGTDGTVHTVVIREKQIDVTNQRSDQREYIPSGLQEANLTDGRSVNIKDEDTFEIVKTGEILRRID